jgi:hypothetical protein
MDLIAYLSKTLGTNLFLCEKDKDMQMGLFSEAVHKMAYWWEMQNYASKYKTIDLADMGVNLAGVHAPRRMV